MIGYFTLPVEPGLLCLSFIGFGCIMSILALYRSYVTGVSPVSHTGASRLFLLTSGFLCAYVSAISVVDSSFPTHVTAHKKVVSLTGRVINVTPLLSGHRVTFDSIKLKGSKPIHTSSRVRLIIKAAFDFKLGQILKLRAVLLPPSAPAVPGGYDFQRYAWFENIKAVGYSVSTPRQLSEPSPILPAISLEHIRHHIGKRFRAAAPGDQGAVAAALITGERQAISRQLTEAYRDAGLAHLLAISGLNIGIYASLVFVVFRRGLAFIPSICLRWPIKKIAAIIALGATTFYLLISGMGTPAQRSWIMSSCVLVAVIFDRHAITFRTFALAAVLVSFWKPNGLLGPSFQMSFAAVLTLVAGYLGITPTLSRWQQRAPTPITAAMRAAGVYLLGIILSTVLSTLATAPYTLYHFHRLPLYGVLANLIAVPITALWIMPGLMLALFLMLFDLEKLALIPLGWGLKCIANVAHTISNLPHANLYSPPMSPYALLIATGSGLWLCVRPGRRKWGACILFCFALLSPWFLEQRPDYIINNKGSLIAVSSNDGLILSPGRYARFARRSWKERWGHSTSPWPHAKGLRCHASSCMLHRAGQVLFFAKTHRALTEHCAKADILITPIVISPPFMLPAPCRKAEIIDGEILQKNGTHAIYLTQDGAKIESTRAHQGNRLWNTPELIRTR